MKLLYDSPRTSKAHLVWFPPGSAFQQAVNQLFSAWLSSKYQGTISIKPFLRNLVFPVKKEQQKIVCCWLMAVKQLHLFFVTCCRSVAVTLAPKAFVLIKRGMILSCPSAPQSRSAAGSCAGPAVTAFWYLLYQKREGRQYLPGGRGGMFWWKP